MPGSRDSFGAPAHAQLAIDTADLGLNRVDGDNQRLCHPRVRLPGDQQMQHFELLGREWLDERRWDGALWEMRQRLVRCGR